MPPLQQNRGETPVYLNVYDLQEGINDRTHWLGVGAYHSGVEVNGAEWSFGHTPEDRTGVFRIEPRTADGCRFRMAIFMGTTRLSGREVESAISRLSDEYWGPTYHILTRNCNSFSDELCRALVGIGVPKWLNRLAYFGSLVRCVLPDELGGTPPTPAAGLSGNEEQSVPLVTGFGGEGVALGSATAAPTMERPRIESSANDGIASRENNDPVSRGQGRGGNPAADRAERERIAKAAEQRLNAASAAAAAGDA